jgi:hypothetical protein
MHEIKVNSVTACGPDNQEIELFEFKDFSNEKGFGELGPVLSLALPQKLIEPTDFGNYSSEPIRINMEWTEESRLFQQEMLAQVMEPLYSACIQIQVPLTYRGVFLHRHKGKKPKRGWPGKYHHAVKRKLVWRSIRMDNVRFEFAEENEDGVTVGFTNVPTDSQSSESN